MTCHPDVLPKLLSVRHSAGITPLHGRESYALYLLLGALVGPFFFWGLTRKQPPEQ